MDIICGEETLEGIIDTCLIPCHYCRFSSDLNHQLLKAVEADFYQPLKAEITTFKYINVQPIKAERGW